MSRKSKSQKSLESDLQDRRIFGGDKKNIALNIQDELNNIENQFDKVLMNSEFFGKLGKVSSAKKGFVAVALASENQSEKNQSTLSLPETAPETYEGNIIDFLRRVWMPWIETGVLTRPDLRRLDEAAYNGLRNWLSLPGNSLESVGLSIPTKSEALRLQKINLPEEERARLEERLRYHRKEVSRISRILGLM